MGAWTIPLRLPDFQALDLVVTGLAVIFHRTRFTIRTASLDPDVTVRMRPIHDRGVYFAAALTPKQREFRLEVHTIGGPIVPQRRILLVRSLNRGAPKPRAMQTMEVEGWIVLEESEPEAQLLQVANPATEIAARRTALAEDKSPLQPHRLFFLRMDEWTDLRTLGEPPSLPPPVALGADDPIVLEALLPITLGNALESWILELQHSGSEMPLTYGLSYTPLQWIRAMSTYLKNVFEYAFQEAFNQPLVTATDTSASPITMTLHPAFAVAFEEFANGNLGELDGNVPKAPQGFPDSAYYFSFAAFAWLAKTKSTDATERAFWRALWPVFAYTADIYRHRYAPTPSGGQYADYKFTTPQAALADVANARRTTMTKTEFRRILCAACSGR